MRHHRALRFAVRLGLLLVAAAAVGVTYVLYPPTVRHIEFPDGKRFAFSIVDDTDQATLQRARPLYEVLHKAGLRTTKTIWSLQKSDEPIPTNEGGSLQEPDYREWVLDLKNKGFEIALHGVRGGSSERTTVLEGLDTFRNVLGSDPRLHVNHALNRENLYWGEHRWWFTPYQWAFAIATPYEFSGHVADSPYFWGDLAQGRVKYVRRYTFSEINLLRVNPTMPYRIPGMSYVNYWFDAVDGGSLDAFTRLMSNQNLDRLEREGGVALVYMHLAAGSFNRESGEPDPVFVERIDALASRNGWFAPASDILDYLARQPGWTADLSAREHLRLDTWFLLDRLF